MDFFDKYYHTRNCTKFVIGTGQWTGNYWTDFAMYATKMAVRINDLGIYYIGKGDIKIYLWSVHHNPIGDLKQCNPGETGPKDFRNPTVIDGYNILLRYIASDFR
jgi:hypothetical protein